MAAEGYANKGDYYVHIMGLHNTVSVKFKAIITSFKDNLQANFNAEEVYGRIDPIMTFQSTTRKLQLNLEIPAADVNEAQKNFESLSQLMASQYPGYQEAGSATSLSTAPLHKIKFANWITSGGTIGAVSEAGLVVALEGVSFSPNLDAGVIEDGPKLLPKQFDLELAMTVLHTDSPGWTPNGFAGNIRKYPYTEMAEEPGLYENDETRMSIDPEDPANPLSGRDGTFFENVQEALNDTLLGPNSGTELGMSYEVFDDVDN
jgi:hypothetical protein